jgi:hypothetical protein
VGEKAVTLETPERRWWWSWDTRDGSKVGRLMKKIQSIVFRKPIGNSYRTKMRITLNIINGEDGKPGDDEA